MVAAGGRTFASDVNAITGRPRFQCNFTGTITNNSVTTLTPSAANVNVGAMWASGTDITVPAGLGGEYEMGIVLRYASQASAQGFRQCRVQINGAELMQWNVPAPTNLNSTNITASGVIRAVLAAGDDISFAAYQNSTVSLALVGTCRAWVERVVQ